MTVDPGGTRRSGFVIAMLVFGVALMATVVVAPVLENKTTFASDFSAGAPVMGRWRLVDDAGLRARGIAAPETLQFEPCVPRPGETLPDGVRADQVARLSSGSREVLLVNHGVWFEYAPGSGPSPFAEVGQEDGLAMLLGLHDVLGGLLDRLTIGLGPDGLMGPPSAALGPRISYARD